MCVRAGAFGGYAPAPAQNSYGSAGPRASHLGIWVCVCATYMFCPSTADRHEWLRNLFHICCTHMFSTQTVHVCKIPLPMQPERTGPTKLRTATAAPYIGCEHAIPVVPQPYCFFFLVIILNSYNDRLFIQLQHNLEQWRLSWSIDKQTPHNSGEWCQKTYEIAAEVEFD